MKLFFNISFKFSALLLFLSLSYGLSKNTYIKNFGLKNTKQLTFIGDNGEAYFSHDDKNLIFQSKRNGHKCDKIYSMTVEGDSISRINEDGGAFTCSYYSLDSKKIFFSSTMKDSSECPEVYKHPNPRKYIWPLRNYDIYSQDNDRNLVNLTNSTGYDAEATVHPYEEKIIFTSKRNGDIDLYEMDYSGENIKRITSEFGYDGGAFFSPDGEQIVWRAWYPKNDEERIKWKNNLTNNYIEAVPLDIYIANRDGSKKIRLTDNGATNWAPSWHPSGRYIVFSSNMDDWLNEHNSYGPNFELYIIEIENGKIQRLTFNKTFDSFPVFSNNGSKIVYSSNRNADNPRQTNIFISDFSIE